MLGTARTARKRLLPAILRSGQKVAAIAGRDPAHLADFQSQFGIPAVYPWRQAERVLEGNEIDAVYIPLPNSLHAAWTVRALEAGKHVLCEKPLALTVADTDRVISAAAAHNRVLMENFSYPFTKTWENTLNPCFPLQAIEVHHSFQATEEHRLRYDRGLGGGSFLDLGCYGVDYVHRLLDCEIRVDAVHAEPPAPERRAWGNVDETCVLRGVSAGVNISITSSFAEPPRQDFTLRFSTGEERRIPRTDDDVALLRAFAAMRESDPADALRWRRNASVYQQVLARMQY